MDPKVGIIIGGTSDWPVMEKAASLLNDFEIPFEVNALSAHITPEKIEEFAKNAHKRGLKVIIAAAGMAAHLPGAVAAITPLPVIGVPIKDSLDGIDALLSISQMPPGVPVATVAINGALNSAILAAQIIGSGDEDMFRRTLDYKESLKNRLTKANDDLSQYDFEYRVV